MTARNAKQTRMHSSRMRTVRNSSRLRGGIPVPGGVPGPGGCTWSQGGVPGPGGYLPRYSPRGQTCDLNGSVRGRVSSSR